jgi:hypothetical protein
MVVLSSAAVMASFQRGGHPTEFEKRSTTNKLSVRL